MKKLRTSRRRFLKLAAGASVATTAAFRVGAAPADARGGTSVGDDRILIEFDSEMRMRLSSQRTALTQWSSPDALEIQRNSRLERFALKEQSKQDIQEP